MVVPNVTELGMIGPDKFKDNPVRLVDSEAPDFMVLRMQFLGVERRMEGVTFEQVCFCDSFPLNNGRQFLKKPIECSSG